MANSIIISEDSIASPASADTKNLFNNLSGAGKVNMCSNLLLSNYSIASTAVTDAISLFKKLLLVQ